MIDLDSIIIKIETQSANRKIAISLTLNKTNECIIMDIGGIFEKLDGTYGTPGNGTSITTFYSCIHAIPQDMMAIIVSIISWPSIRLGDIHIHELLGLHVKNRLSPQRLVEFAFIFVNRAQQNWTHYKLLISYSKIRLDQLNIILYWIWL